VLKPENSLQWHTEVLEWIDRWTEKEENDGTASPGSEEQEPVAERGELSLEL